MRIVSLIKRIWRFLKTERGKKYSLWTAAAIAIFITVALLLPLAFSQNYLKTQTRLAVRDWIGRDLKIDGDVKLSLLPWPSISMENAALSNQKGYISDNSFITVGQAKIDFNLGSLLLGNLKTREIHLDHAQLNLQIDKRGHPNWQLNTPPSQVTVFTLPPRDNQQEDFTPAIMGQHTVSVESADAVAKILKAFPYKLLPPKLMVTNSAVSYNNELTQEYLNLQNINTNFTTIHEAFSVTLKGAGMIEDSATDWFMSASNYKAFSTNERSSLKISLASKAYGVSLTGSIEKDLFRGRANIVFSSLKQTLPELIDHAPFSKVVTPLEFSLNANNFECNSVRCKFGGNFLLDHLSGYVNGDISIAQKLPELKLSLDMPRGDISRFFTSPAQKNSINAAPGLPVLQETTKDSWSKKPIDISLLGLAKANISIKVKQLNYDSLKIGRGQLYITINEKRGEFKIADTEFNRGRVNATLDVDRSELPVKWRAVMNFSGADVSPLMDFILGITPFEGSSNFLLNVNAGGFSPYDLVNSLNGNGIISTINGRIRNIDLADAFRNRDLINARSKKKPTRATDFENLNANFAVKNGVLENNDLKVYSKFITFSGQGKIDFPHETMDYVLTPQRVIKLDPTPGKGSKTIYAVHAKGSINEPELVVKTEKPLDNQLSAPIISNDEPPSKNKPAVPAAKPEAAKEVKSTPAKEARAEPKKPSAVSPAPVKDAPSVKR